MLESRSRQTCLLVQLSLLSQIHSLWIHQREWACSNLITRDSNFWEKQNWRLKPLQNVCKSKSRLFVFIIWEDTMQTRLQSWTFYRMQLGCILHVMGLFQKNTLWVPYSWARKLNCLGWNALNAAWSMVAFICVPESWCPRFSWDSGSCSSTVCHASTPCGVECLQLCSGQGHSGWAI